LPLLDGAGISRIVQLLGFKQTVETSALSTKLTPSSHQVHTKFTPSSHQVHTKFTPSSHQVHTKFHAGQAPEGASLIGMNHQIDAVEWPSFIRSKKTFADELEQSLLCIDPAKLAATSNRSIVDSAARS
jgi:hypothetical protein